MLDFVHKTRHQMALFVDMFVIFALRFAIFTWRDDGLHFFFSKELQKIIRIIRAVRNQAFKFKISNQGFGLGHIMPLTSGQPKAQRVAQTIHIDMDFGAKATSAAPQGLFSLPAVFFEAPAAQGRAPPYCPT